MCRPKSEAQFMYLSMKVLRLLFQIILMHTCVTVECNYFQQLINEVTTTPPALIKRSIARSDVAVHT